jgi:hypothetical protein
MIGPQPFAQPIGESIKLQPPTERAEGRRTDVWTLAAPANRMACRTHSFFMPHACLPLGVGPSGEFAPAKPYDPRVLLYAARVLVVAKSQHLAGIAHSELARPKRRSA